MEALHVWRDLSVVLLVLEAFVLLLVPLAAAFFAARGARWVVVRARPAMRQVQQGAERVRQTTQDVSLRVVNPLIRVRLLPAFLNGLWRGVWGGGDG